jgi:rubredoxin
MSELSDWKRHVLPDLLRNEHGKGMAAQAALPIPMRLNCPTCGALHIDEGEFATKVHHTHACQSCGMVWRPAVGPTVGVRFLPGFKNELTK